MDAASTRAGSLHQVAQRARVARQAQPSSLRHSEKRVAQVCIRSQVVVERIVGQGATHIEHIGINEAREEIHRKVLALEKTPLVFRYERQRRSSRSA